MNLKRLASDIARIEGKKVQVSIGNIREILKIAMILIGKELRSEGLIRHPSPTISQLLKYGKRKL